MNMMIVAFVMVHVVCHVILMMIVGVKMSGAIQIGVILMVIKIHIVYNKVILFVMIIYAMKVMEIVMKMKIVWMDYLVRSIMVLKVVLQ